jgi:lipoprotein NlpD
MLPGLLLATAALLAGCSSNPSRRPPPVEDLGPGTRGAAALPPPPGSENAGKPGYYTVQPGETVRRIAAANGRDWRDIVRWNNLDNPDKIVVGQVLRVVPPGSTAAAAVVPPAGPAPNNGIPVATQITSGASSSGAALPPPPPAASADKLDLMWPAKGPILVNFDGDKNKGIDIGGQSGDPVYAAADGRVEYSGAGIPAYGNMIILEHRNGCLTAYTHNKTNLVKDPLTDGAQDAHNKTNPAPKYEYVKKGQKIAEMGATGTNRVMLHFEVRCSGKPVNPTQYLPAH